MQEMPSSGRNTQSPPSAMGRWMYPVIGTGMCLVLALCMILNTQMGGEGVWFWYSRFFNQGAKLYTDLHLPLQPFIVLETSAWQGVLANRCWVYQIPSLVHALMLCFALMLVLRESNWPRAAKSALLFGGFFITVMGNSYRFDDYHVPSESAIFAGIGLLLLFAKARETRRQLLLAAGIGILSGLSAVTRLNDGTAMVFTAAFCAFVMARRNKAIAALVLLIAAAVTVLFVVRLTGDTVQAWVDNSIVRAVGVKGTSSGFAADPFRMFWKVIKQSVLVWRIWIATIVTFFVTRWAARKRQSGALFLTITRLALLLTMLLLCTPSFRESALRGRMLNFFLLACIFSVYVFAAAAVFRFIRATVQRRPWDRREILLLIPLAEWVSNSVSSSADPLLQYYAANAMFLLLLVVLIPFDRVPFAARKELIAWSTVLLVFMTIGKAWEPYQWQFWTYPPMFTHRAWFQHPVYGPLYLDRDLLDFSLASCADIDGGHPLGSVRPELLALPYPYPNYFCATPPWHGYIQTYFDTTQRSTVEKLMRELETAPPEWIIYQRQMFILAGAEKLYNHGQPLAQRDLDTLIFRKLDSAEWKLVEHRNYLVGEGWFIIRTHP